MHKKSQKGKEKGNDKDLLYYNVHVCTDLGAKVGWIGERKSLEVIKVGKVKVLYR